MSNLTVRALTAVVLVPILIVLILLGGIPFAALVLFGSVAALYEYGAMLETRGFKPQRALSYLLGAAVVISAYLADPFVQQLVVTGSVLAVMVVQLARRDIPYSITGMAVTLLGVIYIAWLLSHAVYLRNFGHMAVARYNGQPGFGVLGVDFDERYENVLSLFFIFFTFACTFLNDTGAYFAGRFLGGRFSGQHKFAPLVSPKKTWEGFAGGVLTAVAAGCFVKFAFESWVPGTAQLHFSYAACAILGGLLGVSGAIGDLVESMLKRDADIKDSGWIIPGHGGMLDRIDALLFTFPITYYGAEIYYAARFGTLLK